MKTRKRIIALFLAAMTVLTLSFTAFAASPVPGSSFYVNTNVSAYNSSTGQKYKQDTGYPYTFLKIKEYDGNPCYCIEKGKQFTRTLYKSQKLSDSTYWNSLSYTVQNGIALTAVFGYPSQTPAQLGVPTADDAFVATQAIIWEYLEGYRTSPTNLNNTAHKATVDGTPAATAYSVILKKMQAHITNPQYKGDIQKTSGFVSLTSASGLEEQELICFYGATPVFADKGRLVINKTDNYGNALSGAEFTVYDENGNSKYKTTVNNGRAIIENVSFGTYTVVETKLPIGFKSDGTKSYRVVLNESSTDLTATVNAVNVDKRGEIRILKTGENMIGVKQQEIAGFEVNAPVWGEVSQMGAVYAVFARRDIFTGGGEKKYSAGEKVGEIVTGIDGKGALSELWLGSYYLKEIKAPVGHSLDDTEYDVILSDDGKSDTVTVENQLSDSRCRLQIELTKLFEDDEIISLKEQYKECYFGIFNQEYMSVGSVSIPHNTLMGIIGVDENGKAVPLCCDLPLGKYYLCELTTAEEYVLSEEKYTFEFSGGSKGLQTVTVNNGAPIENRLKRGSVALTKVDEDYPENTLPGAEFQVFYDKNANGIFEWEADPIVGNMEEASEGKFIMENLPFGDYFVYESKAPQNFVKDDRYYLFSVENNGETVTVETQAGVGFLNRAEKGKIKIIKTDTDTGEPIPDVQFGLFENGGSEFLIATTDLNGELVFENIRKGKYIIKELTCKEGYALNEEEIPVEITMDGQVIELEVKNKRIPSISESPKTGDGTPITAVIITLIVSGVIMLATIILKLKIKGVEK